MLNPKKRPELFEDFVPDFSPDECERRMTEVVRLACGHAPTFNLETGQPLTGAQLVPAELKRRGYDV